MVLVYLHVRRCMYDVPTQLPNPSVYVCVYCSTFSIYPWAYVVHACTRALSRCTSCVRGVEGLAKAESAEVM